MAKITDKSVQAFADNITSAIDNTIVNDTGMFLFGNHIAKRVRYGVVAINFCGYPTRTTADRLNALVNKLTNGRIKVGISKGAPELRYRDGLKISIPCKEWVNIATIESP